MCNDFLDAWLRQSPEHARIFAEEGLIFDASEAICEAMQRWKLTKAALGERIGISESHLTQLLNGNRDMTLRAFAGIAFALEMEPVIKFEDRVIVQDQRNAEDMARARAAPVGQRGDRVNR